jgi:molecular chaperone DnaJ
VVVVPPGVDSHHQLKVSGQGDAGRRGGVNGDIRVRLNIAPHPTFTRDGNDVHVTVNVPLSMAVLGGSVTVPTLTGEATLKVDAGTQPNEKRVMRGKGIKDVARSATVGNEYVTFNITIPTHLTHTQRTAMEQFAKERGEDTNTNTSTSTSTSSQQQTATGVKSDKGSSSGGGGGLFSSLFGGAGKGGQGQSKDKEDDKDAKQSTSA